MERADYLKFRTQYHPFQLKLVIVAESPPSSGKYFYNCKGAVTEPLFSALMQQIDVKPASKELGLRCFQDKGWLLVDATYEPVNDYSNSKKDSTIVRDYPQLRDDIKLLNPDQRAAVVLIKVNVCRLLEDRLSRDGFDVINHGQEIPFPSNGQQLKFRTKFSEVVRRAGF
jgi:hypothetical protein